MTALVIRARVSTPFDELLTVLSPIVAIIVGCTFTSGNGRVMGVAGHFMTSMWVIERKLVASRRKRRTRPIVVAVVEEHISIARVAPRVKQSR